MDDNQKELDYLKDVHTPTMRDIAVETPEEPKVEEPKIEEKVEVVETPIPTAEEIAQKTADELEARQAAEEAETKEAQVKEDEDSYKKWEDELWETEKRTPTYREALDFMQKQAINSPEMIEKLVEAVRGREEEALKAKQEEETKKAEELKKTDEELGKIVDDELNDLYNAGMLTKIQDPNNPSDQGVVEKRDLFKTWLEVNNDRRAKGLPDINSATRIAQFYWKKPNAQPAGADAPVMGSRSSAVPPSTEKEYSYDDLRKPWSFFKRG